MGEMVPDKPLKTMHEWKPAQVAHHKNLHPAICRTFLMYPEIASWWCKLCYASIVTFARIRLLEMNMLSHYGQTYSV